MALVVRLGLAGSEVPTDWIGTDPADPPFSLDTVVTAAAALFGLIGGSVLLEHRGGFETDGVWWRRVLRYPVGLVGVVVIWLGLGLDPTGDDVPALVLRFVQYGLVGLWIGGIAPLVFVRLGLAPPGRETSEPDRSPAWASPSPGLRAIPEAATECSSDSAWRWNKPRHGGTGMTPQTTTGPAGNDLPPPDYPPPRPATAATRERRTPWRERLPELVGAIGTILVVAAIAGFLSAQWEELDQIGRAIVLGAAAAGLTAAANWLEQRNGRLSQLTSMLWVTGSATTGAAVILGASVGLEGMARITALLAGLAIAGHALLAVSRDPSSPLRQLGVVGGALVAAGPFGTDLADRATWDTVGDVFVPFAGLVDPTLTDEAYLYTGIAHLVIGAAWLAWSVRSEGRAAQVGWVGSTTLLAYAALQLHVLPWGIGAFAALLLVLAYLVHGMVTERTGAVVAGTIGALVAGGRVVWSLFSGEVATTIAAFAVGLALLTWAVRARTREDHDTDATIDDDPVDAPSEGSGEPPPAPLGSTGAH